MYCMDNIHTYYLRLSKYKVELLNLRCDININELNQAKFDARTSKLQN